MADLLFLLVAAVLADEPAVRPAFKTPPVYSSCPQGGWVLEEAPEPGVTQYSGVDAAGEKWAILCISGQVYATTVHWPVFPADYAATFVETLSGPAPRGFGAPPSIVRTPKRAGYGWSLLNSEGAPVTFLLVVGIEGGASYTATAASVEEALLTVRKVK